MLGQSHRRAQAKQSHQRDVGETDPDERALTLEPVSSYVYEQMGLFYRRAGNEGKALAAFETSRKLAWNFTSEVNISELKAQQQ